MTYDQPTRCRGTRKYVYAKMSRNGHLLAEHAEPPHAANKTLELIEKSFSNLFVEPGTMIG